MTHFSVGIIIPMYNEEKGAATCVQEIVKVIRQLKIRSRLVVVNDGSTDRTLEILHTKKRQFSTRLVVVNSRVNRGYGAALQLGIKACKREKLEYVIFMDSDLTNSPKDIPRFVELIPTGVDCVKASRYIENGGMVGVPPFRMLISTLGNLVASKVFNLGIADCTNGFRMTRRRLVDDIQFKEKKFSIIMEELYELKKKQARFAQLPVVLTARKNTASNFRYSLATFFNYGKYVLWAALV